MSHNISADLFVLHCKIETMRQSSLRLRSRRTLPSISDLHIHASDFTHDLEDGLKIVHEVRGRL
jgi:hypothetical protein